MNLAHWLAQTAAAGPERPALALGHRKIMNYGEFHAAASAFAAALKARGIVPGDRVALVMVNCPEYLVAFYGTWVAGAAVVPVNSKLHPREIGWILEDAGASLAIVTDANRDALAAETSTTLLAAGSEDWRQALKAPDEEIAHRDAGDLAWLFYTSGTTGRPKGVQITHGMLQAMSLAYFADVDTVLAEDTVIYAAPMSHAAGIYNLMHVLKGARHVCPESGGFDAAEVLELARRYGSVSMFMAPTMVRRFTDRAKASGDRADGIRTIVYAGGPMYSADIIEAVDWFGPKFAQVYGQGECPMSITALSRKDVADRTHPRWRQRLGSVGRAQAVAEVRVGDDDGHSLPPDTVGEIMVRGATVMPGYWHNTEATEKTIVDGWLKTGDVGSLDADGYLTLTDRSKDLIISGGSNIYPREVEEVLLAHADVHEASVVGKPDPEWGEIVIAFVVPVEGRQVDAATLDGHCRANIARFKRPKSYEFLSELPKNSYGKVLKTELRKLLKGG